MRLSKSSGALANRSWRVARRIVVAVVGTTVVLIGVVMLVTPGPAFVVIPAGLGILAIEFEWARRWLRRAREMAQNGLQKARAARAS
jgi:tellurite resistance protein TerC